MAGTKTGVRDRIVQTALPLFATQGFRATGIDRIIADSAVAKASFYRHFPSKDDLILACLERWHISHFAALKIAVEAGEVKSRPLSLFDALPQVSEATMRGDLLITATVEFGSAKPAIADVVAAARHQLREWFETLLGEAGYADMADSLSHEWLLLYEGAMIGSLRETPQQAARCARANAERSLQQIQLKRLLSKTLPGT
ncbi:TetR/AcrR family transcriptional regulator [Asticcacaulis sp.]|jgi:AcrR family transcriptional regulator|uniref:TetR/AcrR family transcriptional regulator n=1 Tax=unclassified Asticcacaulis TaxID=2628350 RepID=UPI0025BCDA92|nr:TetR/AcrR family transcriptional regulator [Asticcacaulis sp.]MCA1936953.1 TetR/AcrR family transcriptional regulator [Asticcacaulis sp.]